VSYNSITTKGKSGLTMSLSSENRAICWSKRRPLWIPCLNFYSRKQDHLLVENKATLPVLLSVDEVQRILGCLRLPRYRVCLSTIYTCGLRLQEWLAALGRALPAGRQWLQRQVPRSLHLPRRHEQPAHPESGGWPDRHTGRRVAWSGMWLTPKPFAPGRMMLHVRG